MKEKQIEKAALLFAGAGEFGECPYNPDAKNGFMAGAQWRINSVWHKPSPYGEELKRDVEVIAKTKRGYRFGKFGVVGFSNEYIGFVSTSSLEYALSDVLEYAYLSDLIPERKETENRGNLRKFSSKL